MTLFKGAQPDNALVLQKRQITIRDTDAQRAVMIRLGRQPLRVREGKPPDLWTTPGGWNITAAANSSRLLASFNPQATPAGRPAVLLRLHTRAMNQTVEQWLLAGDRDHARIDLGLITVDLVEDGHAAPATGAPHRAIVHALPDGSFTVSFPPATADGNPAPLPPGQPVATGWNDWTIEAVQVLASAAPGFRFDPLGEGAATPPGQALLDGVLIRASRNDISLEQWVAAGWRVSIPTGSFPLEISYGWEVARLPFGLVLENFTVERNEGTDDPASFRSDLAMVLPDGTVAGTGSCSMNQPANYPDAFWRSLTGLTYKISQASWNPNDLSQSSVQILRDPGWLGKWTGSLILCAGLVMMFVFRRPSKNAGSTAPASSKNTAASPATRTLSSVP